MPDIPSKEPIISPAPTPSAILQASDLRYAWPGRELFHGFSLDIPPGVTFIGGGDGRGKTSLLRVLAGELPLRTGRLQIKGIPFEEQSAAYRREVFWIEPRTESFDQITADAFFGLQREAFPGFDLALAHELAERLDLAAHRHKQLFMLSTGSKRKVWLAAAFASGAAVTLLDMPFAAVDKSSCAVITGLLQDAEEGSRAFVVADYEAPEGVRLAGSVDLGD